MKNDYTLHLCMCVMEQSGGLHGIAVYHHASFLVAVARWTSDLETEDCQRLCSSGG